MSYQSGFKPSSLPPKPPAPENPYPASYSAGRGGWQTTTYGPSASTGYYSQQPYNGYTNSPTQSYGPFAAPSGGKTYGNGYDAEAAAQVQQWQSAYVNKDDAAKSGKTAATSSQAPIGPRPIGPVLTTDDGSAPADGTQSANVAAPDTRDKTVVRSGGGKHWQDPSLLQWDPNHPRLFVGNLAGEVTDESLFKAFSKYPSLVKARVIRDKRTTKSKSYGFVSFSDSDEYFRAAREMEGKYIGSHPVQIKRAVTNIKAVNKSKADARMRKNKKGNKDKSINEVEQEVYEEEEIPMEPEYAGYYEGPTQYPAEAAKAVVPKVPVTKVAGHANTGAGVKKNKKEKSKGVKASSAAMRIIG